MQTNSGTNITPETAMQSPTVQAIVNAISRRVMVSPIHVMRKEQSPDGKERKIRLPDHPVQRLLNAPNDYQTRSDFWLDMTAQLVLYGNLFAYKLRPPGSGAGARPVRQLLPLHASMTRADLSDDDARIYRTTANNTPAIYSAAEVLHARGRSSDFLNGNSPVAEVREAIGLEIAAERFGATFFGNGAMPMLVFQLLQGFKDFKTTEEQTEFLDSVRLVLGRTNAHKAFMLPAGIELADANKYSVDNDKAQFVDSRKYQRTVIAGAFGVPPHLVGDLERATFNNVEQQDSDFTINVVLPYVRMIEAALERDLLRPRERFDGLVIRFNLDAVQRADFKSRQEGLQIQRLNGVINANEWRERESMNPIRPDEDGGDDYWRPANYVLPGQDEDEDESDGIPANGPAIEGPEESTD